MWVWVVFKPRLLCCVLNNWHCLCLGSGVTVAMQVTTVSCVTAVANLLSGTYVLHNTLAVLGRDVKKCRTQTHPLLGHSNGMAQHCCAAADAPNLQAVAEIALPCTDQMGGCRAIAGMQTPQ